MTDSRMILHCGGKQVDFEELADIPLPQETRTYKPVAHQDMIRQVTDVAMDVIGKDYVLDKEIFAVARNGNQLFAIVCYNNPYDLTARIALSFRNSYDKSMSAAIAGGAAVTCCDNLMLRGDALTFFKKHSPNILEFLEEKVITVCYKMKKSYEHLMSDAQALQQIPVADDQAMAMIGQLYGKDLITPRQIPVARDAWRKPPYEEFEPRNMWSFYNAVTEAMKTTPPSKVMERHIDLHDYAMGMIGFDQSLVDLTMQDNQEWMLP